MRQGRTPSQKGFTLVEVIITIIAAGIMAAFFAHFMGTALQDSSTVLERVVDEASAEAKMEEIIADYVEAINSSNPDSAFAAFAATDYGTNVTMQFIEFIIEFNAGSIETPPTSNDTLKVTVQYSGHALVTLLTKSRDAGDPIVRY